MSTPPRTGPASNTAVARHPIYRLDGDVYGYELLYRTIGGPNAAIFSSNEEATLSVLATGIQAISGDIGPDKKIFINFSREILEKNYHRILDPQRFVLEVLESITCDAAFTKRIRDIHEAGFVLALDDYVGNPALDPILPFVTYVKIDFLALRHDPARLHAVIDASQKAGKIVLAEKVETEAEIALCRERGIQLAQGFYYSRPQIVMTRVPPANRSVALGLLTELDQPSCHMGRVREYLASDVALTYRLLCYVNGPGSLGKNPVQSLDAALAQLDRDVLTSWLAVNVLATLGDSPRDRELAFASAVRGRFLKLIDQARGGQCHTEESVCLLGLFSLLDAMLGTSMQQALREVSISEAVRRALLGQSSRGQSCLTLCRGYTGLPDTRAAKVLAAFGVSLEAASKAYFEALAWASTMFRQRHAPSFK